MRVEEAPRNHKYIYDSVGEVLPLMKKGRVAYMRGNTKWSFMGVSGMAELEKLVTSGWGEEADTALDIAEQGVAKVEKDYEVETFRAVWDVSGCEVDVARYLNNEPENMIDYEMAKVVRAGRVITLCASVCYSSAVSQESIIERGHGIAALAFALNTLGYATELWADFTVKSMIGPERTHSSRVLVKGPNDALDPAMIMFAFAHPATSRGLIMPAMLTLPDEMHGPFSLGVMHGYPHNPIEDMADGTIYLPCVRSSRDVPEAFDMLIKHLTELGIIHN